MGERDRSALRIRVRGTVQGVGFRPFVHALARQYGLAGRVYNDGSGVVVEAEGDPEALARFREELASGGPPGARVREVAWEVCHPQGRKEFAIDASTGEGQGALVPPDVAICTACLEELLDPAGRRYRYPFVSCTACGPRFTAVRSLPYDRERTTMAPFPLCPLCHAEYRDPESRWFHAQTMACPACGPRLWWEDSLGSVVYGEVALRRAVASLGAGEILAVKGVGGYHLVADAGNEAAVARLRARKRRPAKPLAIMVRGVRAARLLAEVSPQEEELLGSWRRPVVLLRRRAHAPLAPGVAPGLDTVGVLLPYTGLHVLLLEAWAETSGREPVLVCTSANLSGEPIVYRDAEARARLKGIADGWLGHEREIAVGCDDSVVRAVAAGVQVWRRSRGYVPEAVPLPVPSPVPLLAVGGQLKNTVCLVRGAEAFVSQHLGDLEQADALRLLGDAVEHMRALTGVRPAAVAHDLHPGYLSTQIALEMSVPVKVPVQHHHAHIASVLAEHGLHGPVIGLAADGTGYGPDGTVWGGELLVATLTGFRRLAHLPLFPLPGGEAAIRQPWRVAAVWLDRVFGEGWRRGGLPRWRAWAPAWERLRPAVAARVNTPLTSSLGRVFDAVAALLGVCEEVTYEGQAAAELEALARAAGTEAEETEEAALGDVLDPVPLVRRVCEEALSGVPREAIARRFHTGVARMLCRACAWARERTGIGTVALSGGVFQNALVLEEVVRQLGDLGFAVYRNEVVPPGDGGLSLGQAAVAAAKLARSV